MAAAEAAIANPLLDETSMKGAKGLLISITGGRDLTLFEVDEAATRIREEVDPDANIIFGATFDEALEGIIRVSVVAAGLRVLIHPLEGCVMSFTSPASACCLSMPPPQDWNRSGGVPPCVEVVSLALNASFSSGCDVDLDIAVRGHRTAWPRRPDRQHRLVVLDVPPVDGHRLRRLAAEEPLLSSLLLPQAATTAASARDICSQAHRLHHRLSPSNEPERGQAPLSLAGALTHHKRCREFHATVLALDQGRGGPPSPPSRSAAGGRSSRGARPGGPSAGRRSRRR